MSIALDNLAEHESVRHAKELAQANQALRAEIAERIRANRLLQVLNAAALAMQRALTPEEVFLAVAEGFKKLDFHCAILPADERQSRLFTKYLSFDTASFGTAETPAGVRHNIYSFSIQDVDTYKDVVRERKTLFLDAKMVEEMMRQAVPGSTQELARQLVGMMGTPKSIAAPLIAEDRVIGVLSIYSADLIESDMPAITVFAHQVAAAWHRAQLYEETRQGATELAALNETSQAIASSLDLDEVLAKAMTGAKAMLNVEATSVLLYDAASDELVFAAITGPASEALAGARMPATAGIVGWALQKAQPVLVRDAQSDPRFYDRIDALAGLTTRSLLAVPLWYKETIIGVMEAINKVGRPFDEHDLELSIALANSIASAIENARLYEAEREQRKQVEQSQAQLVRSEKLTATGRLAASLAHEINNPLQIVHNSLQLMLNLPFGPDKRQEYLQMADAEVERLIEIVTRILEFARPSRRKMQPTDVNDAIEKALALTAKYLQHSHIALQRDLSPALPPVAAAPDELRQVFLNLMLNAVDAMPEGGSLYVSSWLGDDGRLAVAFADTGPGIPPEHLERVFEPFFSTKEEGTGLGLSISHEVVERHEGEITVKSVTGKGTTFTVWLPVIAE